MKKLLILSTSILCLSAQSLISQPVFAQTPADTVMAGMRHISVSGTSKEQFSPDQAILSMSLVSKNADLNKAKAENDQMVEKLVNITKGFNIPKQNIATSNIYISPEYNYQQNRKPQLIGYTVNRQLRITMDSLNIHEKLLSSIVEAKIDQVNGLEFRLAKPEERAMQLRVKAFENAKAKAETLAQAAGAKLGKVLIISTNSNSVNMPSPPMPMFAKAMRAESADSMSVAPSLPGMVELEESVSVAFSLE